MLCVSSVGSIDALSAFYRQDKVTETVPIRGGYANFCSIVGRLQNFQGKRIAAVSTVAMELKYLLLVSYRRVVKVL